MSVVCHKVTLARQNFALVFASRRRISTKSVRACDGLECRTVALDILESRSKKMTRLQRLRNTPVPDFDGFRKGDEGTVYARRFSKNIGVSGFACPAPQQHRQMVMERMM